MRTLLLFAAGAWAVAAQQRAELLLHQNFEASTAGWIALGEGAAVKPGASGGALAFEYTLAPKLLQMLALPAPATLPQAGHFRFSVKSDHSTAMALFLSERKPGGGNYSAWFWAPANQWQAVDLTPGDFTAADGPDDPVDADGKLDLDAVEFVGLLDLAQFFGTLKSTAALPVQIAETAGRHRLLMNRFEVLAAPAAGAPALAAAIDRGFLDWVTPGAMDLKLSEKGNPLGERAIEASYQHRDGELDLLLRREGRPGEAAAPKPKRLAFDIASENEATLVVSLEMKKPGGGEGPHYTQQIYPPGGREVLHVNLKLSDFDGPDKFDPAEWRTTAIVDVTGGNGRNTIWIGNLRTEGD